MSVGQRADLPAGLVEALNLKGVDRAGWLRVGVPRPESVAAHSWGIAWLALALCPPALDLRRILAMAILHDLPEVRVGDLTPHDGVDRATKHAAEREAAEALFAGRPDLLELWHEYERQESAEARFVHGLDKLDMGLQAGIYASHGVDTAEFVKSALHVLPEAMADLLLKSKHA